MRPWRKLGDAVIRSSCVRSLQTFPWSRYIVEEDLGSTLRPCAKISRRPRSESFDQPQQSGVRAVRTLDLLQKEIDQPAKVNLILLSETSPGYPTSASSVKVGCLTRF